MDAAIREQLKSLPQVNVLLKRPEVQKMIGAFSHSLIKLLCQEAIAARRQEILAGASGHIEEAALVNEVQERLGHLLQPRLKKVLNCTGILLHTGLGRAPLSEAVYLEAFRRANSACDLEIDLETGQRGNRQDKLRDLLRIHTGAASAAIVNNNAAAVLLTLNTLAYRRETVIARGQLIEIGGSFRLPEVMKKSGTRLVEVGTTNRTYLRDYEEALSPKTGAVLLAHTSNYRIKGFAHEVEVAELAGLCSKHSIPLIHDLGGGVLLDLKKWQLPAEPVVSRSIAAGCSVVTFSGDKILGGPQAGIIVGENNLLERIRKNALMRALRPDKFTLALLEETLKLYLRPEQLLQHHPILQRLTETDEEAYKRAHFVFQSATSNGEQDDWAIEVAASKAQLGSGALPLEEFPSAALRLKRRGASAAILAASLRKADPPIIGYVHKSWICLDLKAVADDDLPVLISALKQIITGV